MIRRREFVTLLGGRSLRTHDASPNFAMIRPGWRSGARSSSFTPTSWTVARSSFALPPPTFGEGIPC